MCRFAYTCDDSVQQRQRRRQHCRRHNHRRHFLALAICIAKQRAHGTRRWLLGKDATVFFGLLSPPPRRHRRPPDAAVIVDTAASEQTCTVWPICVAQNYAVGRAKCGLSLCNSARNSTLTGRRCHRRLRQRTTAECSRN